jgi:hypothetical protein
MVSEREKQVKKMIAVYSDQLTRLQEGGVLTDAVILAFIGDRPRHDQMAFLEECVGYWTAHYLRWIES